MNVSLRIKKGKAHSHIPFFFWISNECMNLWLVYIRGTENGIKDIKDNHGISLTQTFLSIQRVGLKCTGHWQPTLDLYHITSEPHTKCDRAEKHSGKAKQISRQAGKEAKETLDPIMSLRTDWIMETSLKHLPPALTCFSTTLISIRKCSSSFTHWGNSFSPWFWACSNCSFSCFRAQISCTNWLCQVFDACKSNSRSKEVRIKRSAPTALTED